MGYADDIAKLRQEGASDDEILKTYREIAPQDSTDIDKLMGEGVGAKDILDTITSSPAKPKPQAPGADDGILEKGRKALQYGAANRAIGYGATARNLGMGENWLEKAGKANLPENYKSASADFFDPQGGDKGIGGYGWGYLPRMLLESTPGLLMDLGAGVATGGAGFLASNAASSFGGNVDARVENNGGKAAGATDYAAAAGISGLGAYLNRLGITGAGGAANSALKGAGLEAAKRVPGVLASSAAKEGLTEGAQNIVEQAGQTAGTDKGLNVDIHQTGGAAIAGGAMGAGLRATTLPGDAVNAVRQAGTDQDSNIRVAERLKGLDNGITDSGEQFRALKTVQSNIDTSVGVAKTKANWLIKEAGAEEAVANARATLKTGEQLTSDQLGVLKEALGGHADGVKLLEDLTDFNTLNRIKQSGTVDKTTESFDGGIIGKMGNILDPKRMGKTLFGKAAGGFSAASALELPFAAQAGITFPAIAKFLAAQSALYAGAKGVDKVMGNSNPVATFRDQFSGLDQTPKADAEPATARMSPAEMKDLANQTKLLAKAQGREKQLANQLAGIEEGARNAADKETAQAEAQKAKETEAAWKALAALKAQEDSQSPALSDKAWSGRDPKLPKAADEEALWAAQERQNALDAKAQADADAQNDVDLALAQEARDALAAKQAQIDAELLATERRAEMEAKTQAEKEAARKASETDAGWKAYERMMSSQKAPQGLSDRLWAPKEAPKPVDPKARQVDDLFAKAEAETDGGWSDHDAESAIQKAYKEREATLSKAFAGKKPEKAPKEAKEPKAPKETNDTPKTETSVDQDTISITVGNVTAVRPKEGIKNLSSYQAKVRERMKIRQAAIDDFMDANPTGKHDLEALAERLTNSSKNWEDAASHIEDYITDRSSNAKLVSKLWDIYNIHEGKLRGTYGNDKAPR